MLNDSKIELQKASKLNRLEAAHVDSMAAIGNACAHNLGSATADDVRRLLTDVRDFIAKHG